MTVGSRGGAAKARDEDEAMAAPGKRCVTVNVCDGSVCCAVADCTAPAAVARIGRMFEP